MPEAQGRASKRVAVVPSGWTTFFDQTHIPAAVRVDRTMYLTGHTGDVDGSFDPDPTAQIRTTFANIAETLAEAGATWADVVELTSYHLDLRGQAEQLLEVAADFLTSPYPAWSAVGVTELFEPEAVIEISCVAVIPPD